MFALFINSGAPRMISEPRTSILSVRFALNEWGLGAGGLLTLASRQPQAASRKPQAASRKPQAASRKRQAA